MNEQKIVKKKFIIQKKCEKKSDCIISMLLFNLNMYIKASISKQDKKKSTIPTKKKVVHKRHTFVYIQNWIEFCWVGLFYYKIE